MNDYAKAESMITQVLFQNQERVSLQAEALKEALQIVSIQKDRSCHVVVSENFHRGIIGLIATSLAQSTQKPCFVGSLDLEENKIVGSCRRPEDSEASLVQALESVSTHLLRFGGHAQAAGFETDLKNINEVTVGLQKFFNQQVKKVSVSKYDKRISTVSLALEPGMLFLLYFWQIYSLFGIQTFFWQGIIKRLRFFSYLFVYLNYK
jgi:single-stranded DNA-specific DHH superfamily exonuclease